MNTRKQYVEQTYTVAEYLAQEEQADYKSEYRNGKIVNMSGGTLNHGKLITNVGYQLERALEKSEHRCLYFGTEIKIHVDTANSFVYSDGMLVCGEVEVSDLDQNAITNPVLVVEVLSESTERYDRSAKFRKYCSLPAFKEYILIDQYQPIVDSLYRMEKGYWKMQATIGLDKSLYINTLDCHIPLEDIYKNTRQLQTPQFRLDF